LDGQLDRSVGQRVLGDRVTFLAGFEFGPLHGVSQHEAIKLFFLSPVAIEVVKAGLILGRVDDDGVVPIEEPDCPAGRLAGVVLCGPVDWFGQREPPGSLSVPSNAEPATTRQTQTNGQVRRTRVRKGSRPSSAGPTEQAIALRDTLRESVTKSNKLIRALTLSAKR
jgi:hypothetical protein